MNNLENIQIFIENTLVGTLAKSANSIITFQYDSEWLDKGFSISPFSLPLEEKLFIPAYEPFLGLFGVFCDSFPYGNSINIDPLLIKNKIEPDNLNRLAILKDNGLGAIAYKPGDEFESENKDSDYYKLVQEYHNFLHPHYENLDDIAKSQGLLKTIKRKVFTKINGEDWIIKLPNQYDSEHAGELEYKCSLIAKDCGINMPETKLFDSELCCGYYGIKRFDRKNGKKIHTISVSGLVETNWHQENFDYDDLMKLTLKLTQNYQDIEQLYRLMCFNVFARNKDDHLKQFSFIYEDTENNYRLAPAYDLNYNYLLMKKRRISVNSERDNPTMDDILSVAVNNGIEKSRAKDIALEIKDKCSSLQN